MTCNNIDIKLFDYAEGKLAASEAKDIEKHLVSCHSCKNLVSQYKSALQIIKEESVQEVKPFLYTRIEVKLQNTTSPKYVSWKIAPIFLSAAITIGVIFGFFLTNLYIPSDASHVEGHEISYLFNDLRIENVEYNLTKN